jgi:hypothetical protein
MKRATLTIICLCLLSCGISSQKYFPDHAFHEDPTLNKAYTSWYSGQLKALGEPSLWELSQESKQQVYRFLWLRTFDQPVAIRVEFLPDESSILTVKIADGVGGGPPGKLIENLRKEISRDKTRAFLDDLEGLKYWDLPSMDPKPGGSDGARWVIEAAKGGRYKIVDRWSPKDGPVRDLGLYLVTKIAELHIPRNDVY